MSQPPTDDRKDDGFAERIWRRAEGIIEPFVDTERDVLPRDAWQFILFFARQAKGPFILLLIVGGLFVMETASVIIQVFWFKRTGKRIFRMAPIHHHFEQLGWKESTVVIRFWIIAIVLAVLGLATLKLR